MGALRCVSLRASGVGRAPAPSPRKGCSGSPLSVFGGFPRPAPCGRGCGRYAPLAHWSPPRGRVSGCRLGSLWGRLCRIPRPVPSGAVFLLAPLALAPPRGSPRSLRSRSCRLRSSRPRVPLAARSLRSPLRVVSSRPAVAPSLLASVTPASLRSASPPLVWSVKGALPCLGVPPRARIPRPRRGLGCMLVYFGTYWGCRPKPCFLKSRAGAPALNGIKSVKTAICQKRGFLSKLRHGRKC